MNELLQNLAREYYSPHVCARGERYYHQRRVRITYHDETRVDAEVTGSNIYKTSLFSNSTDGTVEISANCSCAYFNRFGACKHVWALLVAADEHVLMVPPNGAYYQRTTPAYLWEIDGEAPGSGVGISTRGGENKSVRREPVLPWKAPLVEMKNVAPDGYDSQTSQPQPSKETVLEVKLSLESDYQPGCLLLTAHTRTRLQNGGLSKPKPLSVGDIPPDFSEEDYILAAMLLANRASPSYYLDKETITLDKQAGMRLLPRLCRRGSFMATRNSEEWGPLTWDGDVPWALELEVTPSNKNAEFVFDGLLMRGNERRPVRQLIAALDDGWLLWPNEIGQLTDTNALHWINRLMDETTLTMPATVANAFVADLLSQSLISVERLPEILKYSEVRVEPRPQLNVHKVTDLRSTTIGASVTLHYGEMSVPANAGQPVLINSTQHTITYRNAAKERAFIEDVKQLGAKYQNGYSEEDPYLFVPINTFTALMRQLIDRGWSIMAEGKPFRSASRFDVSVSSDVDWFDLHVNCDFDGAFATLPELLAALQSKRGWIKLSDGSVGVLPEEWLEKYAGIASFGEVNGDAVRFKNERSFLLDAWLEEQPDARLDEEVLRMRDRIARFNKIKEVSPPAGFRGKLRDYQNEGLAWLIFLQEMGFGGCLADEMGLGKTVQVLAVLESRRARRKKEELSPSLVVVPRSLIFNWKREAEKFCPRLSVLEYTGTDRLLEAGWEQNFDIVLTTYGTIRQDIEVMKKIAFDYVILDESQAIKNANAKIAKCVRLLQGKHRLAMSGTPVENHLGELWSLFEFLNPGLLGAAAVFDRTMTRVADPKQREMLARALRPFILRRTKKQVAPELPDRQEDTLFCDLPPLQRRQYEELRSHYRDALLGKIDQFGLNKSKIIVLEALLRLRQAACHPALIAPKFKAQPCAKFDALLPLLMEVLEGGHKALVFSQFTSFLSLLREQLDASGIVYEYLDGQTTDRQRRVERFQSDPKCPLFLISLKAGGLGLNLTAAEYVFLLDPWWNPAVEAQAIDRAHRIGQTQKVMAYRLIAKDTVEEKVLALQESKRELANAILNENNAILRNLTREDLEFLLG